MVESIATSLGGLQKASQQAAKAANEIASFPAGLPTDIVDVSPEAASGSLEASIVSLKTAAIMYKANAKALEIAFETQKEAFEELI